MTLYTQNVEFVTLPDITSPIALRPDTSDFFVLSQIFINKDYDINIPLSPKFIIDGGANIGCSPVFFANKYPGAKIIAVEPESSNFELLSYNTYFYKDISLCKSGIWDKDTYIKVVDTGLDKWGFMVKEADASDKEAFQATSIETLLNQSGFDFIDILKLDIEGAEKEVFTNNYEAWLGKVGILIVELHDRMKAGCSEVFNEAVSKYNFTTKWSGENMVLFNNEIFAGIV